MIVGTALIIGGIALVNLRRSGGAAAPELAAACGRRAAGRGAPPSAIVRN